MPRGSYGHKLERITGGWLLVWYVDWWSYVHKVYMPREFTKTTHLQGARRFAKKWGLEPPKEN